jgi:predicted dehydrogenase
MKEVRLGVIGCGFMGQLHMKNFPTMPRMKFTAAADAIPAKLDAVVQQYKVQGFADGNDLIKSGLVDAVLIATPHYQHPTYTMAAFKAGLHVLTEKPVAVTAKAAAEVNAEHRKHKKLVYAAMFQMRTYPVWRKMKEMVASGQIGEIQRVSWTITNWFRSQAYYDSGGWRATWGGEGGGVLLNQCPHNLDLFQWIVGMPSKVTAFISLGKYHHIEVEDEVTAYLEYPKKATGVFTTSTGEAPGVNRFEIAGDRGLLVSDSSRKIEFTRTEMSVTEHRMTTRESFPRTPTS